MTSILTNNGAMVALQTLRSVNKDLTAVSSQISTGKKVANAADNAAIFAVTSIMQADISGFNAISESLSLGKASISVARNASEKITELLREVKEKVVAAQDSSIDKTKIQTDIDELKNQIDTIVNAAQFNGLNMLDGTSTDALQVLSSLDRSPNGVTTSTIGVNRQDLSTSATTVGTGVGGTVALVDAAATETVNASANFDIVASTNASANTVEVVVDGTSLGTLDIASGTNDTDAAVAIADFINAAGVEGLAATIDGANAGRLVVSSEKAFDDFDVEINLTGAGDATVNTNAAGDTATINPGLASRTLDANANVFSLTVNAGTTTAETNDLVLTIGTTTLTVTIDNTTDAATAAADAANAVVNAINAAGITGVTATVDSGTTNQVNISNANAFSDLAITALIDATNSAAGDATAVLANTSGTTLFTAAATTGGASTPADLETSTLNGASKDLTLTARTVAEGDSYSIQLRKDLDSDGSSDDVVQFDYVAKAGDTLNDVALGLQAAIEADSRFSEVTIAVDTAADSTIEDVGLKLATTVGTVEAAISSASGGAAGGGLGQLANLDVTTAQGASQALADIELLIQTAVDASAAFGSSEKRIDIQSEFVDSLVDGLTAGIGALVDADMEKASARLQALQVQQQLGTQALSIANSAPQSVLSLFR